MCGIPRPSTGHRIAIMFPPRHPSSSTAHPATANYSLFFRESDSDSMQTTAVFRSKDTSMIDIFRACRGIDLRIERHGDLTLTPSTLLSPKSQPLHQFQLQPHFSTSQSKSAALSSSELEFSLPERLDLGVSERGIVGRQVTVFATGQAGEVIPMGNGIVGYD
ncbi:hypothetical protein BJX68DRAFT_239060 [Aspergillus pseudodeflectus]|uniref:Uncharacterized protein n=1 Tax=Aspergillus pseudodeflectus TaxID=176178 RepID=A0ABR4K6I8_9EURO